MLYTFLVYSNSILKRRVRKDTIENDSQLRLMKYKDDIADSIKDLVKETDFSFTQIQNMINEAFFEDKEANIEEVFGELEEVDSDDSNADDNEDDEDED